MTTKDGIGAPRKPSVVERDRVALEFIRRRDAEGKCTRLSDVSKILDPSLSRGQVFYVIKRLQAAGLIERRAGYLWCLTEDVSFGQRDGAQGSERP